MVSSHSCQYTYRNLPIAIVISNILLTTLYALVNLTYLVVLNKEETFSSEAVAIVSTLNINNIYKLTAIYLMMI